MRENAAETLEKGEEIRKQQEAEKKLKHDEKILAIERRKAER